ncbi:MAG: glycosyltransferase 4 family protein [Candidatus Hydrothermarchaeales archaeon]
MFLLLLAFGFLSFFITLAVTPGIARTLKNRGVIGIDLHKEDGREVPEMVGLAILLGFLVSLSAAYLYYGWIELIIGTLVVILAGAIGIVDGVRKLGPMQKMLSLTIVGLVLVPYAKPTLFGYNLGIIYLLALPLLFAIACNFTNMLAGFNGLEVGTGAIASLGIALLALLNNAQASFALAFTMFCVLLAFLYYNRYPARAFPGDVGTLPIGAALFTAVILGKFELAGSLVFVPYAIDAALKYFSVGVMTRESQKPTLVREGKLYTPEGGNISLPRLFLVRHDMTEIDVVHRVWAVEAVFCSIAFALEVFL